MARRKNLRPDPTPFIEDFRRQQRMSMWRDFIPADFILIVTLAILIVVGLIAITSSSMHYASSHAYDEMFYLARHVKLLCFGAFLGYLCYWFSEDALLRISSGLLIGVTILLVFTLFEDSKGGANRWIKFIGIGFQVSELLKLAMLLMLAKFISSNQRELVEQSMRTVLILLGIFIVPVALVAIQPDFGSTVIFAALIYLLLVIANVQWRVLAILLAVGAIALGVLFFAASYRSSRFFAFLNPWENPLDTSYQLTRALIAVHIGGYTGQGLGSGLIKHGYLPEPHNDYIFATIAEETGFIGSLFVIALYSVLTYRCFVIARRAARVRRYFASYYIYGVGILTFIQAFVHIGVNIGVLPTKGLTLPFISYGGSSVVIQCIIMAIVLRFDMETFRQARREGKLY